jgi:hypothetical protein
LCGVDRREGSTGMEGGKKRAMGCEGGLKRVPREENGVPMNTTKPQDEFIGNIDTTSSYVFVLMEIGRKWFSLDGLIFHNIFEMLWTIETSYSTMAIMKTQFESREGCNGEGVEDLNMFPGAGGWFGTC